MSNNSYRFYTSIIITILWPVGVATLSSGTVKLFTKDPEILNRAQNPVLTHSLFKEIY